MRTRSVPVLLALAFAVALVSPLAGARAAAEPSISYIYPSSGFCGTLITINGNGFGSSRGDSYVSFGTSKATDYTLWRSYQIRVNVPAGCYWTRDVKVTTLGGGSNARSFKVKPKITGVSPTSGKIGSCVEVTGNGFGSHRGAGSVYFEHHIAATSATSWTNSRLVAKIPSMSTGKTCVTVYTNGGTGNSYPFTVK